ncbi:MAG: ribosomal protein L11 methyltransferase [Lentimonas sp.]|jgi:ribosomal protein L11 methyltransferase
MDYLEWNIDVNPREPWCEILVAELSDAGFDGFVDTETGIQAYIPEDSCIENEIKNKINSLLSKEVRVGISIKMIPHQNWNANWESDFKPVFVEDKLTILAPFHTDVVAVGRTIIIQPQMSFGTGHHQTTWMMSKALMELNVVPPKVLDMGTGTGILAILAEQLGAKEILAIDIEEWSAQNAKENAGRNACTNIITKHGDVDLIQGLEFGLIIANINKNVLKAQMSCYAKCCLRDGYLMLSGFFETDVEEMRLSAKQVDFEFVKLYAKESWAAILLKKN